MCPAFKLGVIVSFHNDLSALPGIDGTGSDGRVSINVAGETRFEVECIRDGDFH